MLGSESSRDPASNPSSERQPFRCPACRARQPLQETCRRCGAELTLLAKVRRRVEFLMEEHRTAIQAADTDRARHIQKELKQLAPKSVQ